MFYMLEDQRLEPTATTHEKKGRLSSIHLQGITFQPFIFRVVHPKFMWAIYNDLSRRLVTPNGGEK